ncbi:MAG TPA: CrcB family protein [Natronosporangium sp.]
MPGDPAPNEPRPRRPGPPRNLRWDAFGAVALGGVLGAAARYGVGLAWPAPPDSFPWATFTVNVTGCALIGVLMGVLELIDAHPLIRPFAGTGILGGYTTFSSYAIDIERLVAAGAPRTGLLYLVATPLAAIAAVWVTAVLTRAAVGRHVRCD